MSKYSLILSNLVSPHTKIKVLELCKNDESIFQSFISEIEKDTKLFNQLSGAVSIIENSANLLTMPKGKFRPIEGHNLNCKVYEAKKGIIRVYLFHQENTGRIIVTGGKKGNQKKDIKSIIKTIQDYYNEQGE